MSIDNLIERNDLFINGMVKPTLNIIMNRTCKIHTEMSELTNDLLSSRAPVLFVGLHKSLWETVGILYILSKEYGFEIPYPVMAHTLVYGKIPHWFMQQLGVDITKRGGGRGNVDSTIERIQSRLYGGNSVLIFPGKEKGRQKGGLVKPFETTAFDALIQMQGPRRIVPVNVDYVRVNELYNLTEINEFFDKDKHYVFKLKHVGRWLRKIGDIYITFGDPIHVTSEMDRKWLADYSRKECLNLVNILTSNIVSDAMLRVKFDSHGNFNKNILYGHIEAVKQEYRSVSDKFRGFDMNTSPKKIVELSMLPLDAQWMGAYKLYSNYTSHYLPKR